MLLLWESDRRPPGRPAALWLSRGQPPRVSQPGWGGGSPCRCGSPRWGLAPSAVMVTPLWVTAQGAGARRVLTGLSLSLSLPPPRGSFFVSAAGETLFCWSVLGGVPRGRRAVLHGHGFGVGERRRAQHPPAPPPGLEAGSLLRTPASLVHEVSLLVAGALSPQSTCPRVPESLSP